MTKFKLAIWCALLAAAAPPASGWPTALVPGAAEQVEALIASGLPGLALERATLDTDVPAALVGETKLRAALDRADRREVDKQLAAQPPSPIAHLARALGALERGQPATAERHARDGLALFRDKPARGFWELSLVCASAMLRQQNYAGAVHLLLELPGGRDALPWSPYIALLNLEFPEDVDRARIVRMALQEDSYNPEGRAHAVRLALLNGDNEASDRQFFEHAKLRAKRIARFQPARGRRTPWMPALPVYGPVNSIDRASVYGEFARLAINRDNPVQARQAHRFAKALGPLEKEAGWLFARVEMEFGEMETARKHLEPLAKESRYFAPELALAQSWTGQAREALETLKRVTRQRDSEPVPRLARLRALLDTDPRAAHAAIAAEAVALGIQPLYWTTAALAAHRRHDEPAVERAIQQLVFLRRMSRITEIKCFQIGLLLKELDRQGLVGRLRRRGRDRDSSSYDGRGAVFSALIYRLFADRASATEQTDNAMTLLGHAYAAMEQFVMGRLECTPADLEPALRAYLPRLSYDISYPLAQVIARVRLQMNDAPGALRALDVFLPHAEPLSSAWFLLEAAALGQLGQRDRTNSMVAAGTLLGVRVGIPWSAFAQLLLVTGSDEGLHALARAARTLRDAGDNLDDFAAVMGLGGLYADALQTVAPTPGRGTDLGRGLALAALGRDAEARRALAAAASEPGAWLSPALAALAELEYRAGDVRAVRAVLAQLEAAKVDDYRVYDVRTMIALLENDAVRAEAEVAQALARASHAAQPHLLAAEVARRRKQSHRLHLTEAVRLAPHDARTWEALGRDRLAVGEDARANLREAARQCVDSGLLARAVEVLELLPGAPAPARPRYPYTDPWALRAAFLALLAKGPPALRNDVPGQDLAREGALQLIELGDDAGALRMVQEAIAREPRPVAATAATSVGAGPLPRHAAALLMLVVLLLGPRAAGLGLKRAAAR